MIAIFIKILFLNVVNLTFFQKLQESEAPDWGTPDNKHPPDAPECGFFNELCPEDTSGTDDPQDWLVHNVLYF